MQWTHFQSLLIAIYIITHTDHIISQGNGESEIPGKNEKKKINMPYSFLSLQSY